MNELSDKIYLLKGERKRLEDDITSMAETIDEKKF
jgi:hypothetical protein